MKRIVLLGGALVALSLLFASCDMSTSDSDVSSNYVPAAEAESSNVKGVILRIDDIKAKRTILPADWTDDTAEKLSYVLLAKKTGADSYETKATFSYAALKGGTAIVNLDLVAWDLKLIGYMLNGTDADETKPCLSAELKNVDLSTGKKTVTFDLEPVTEDTSATGNADVTIAWITSAPKRLEFGIYASTKTTDEIVQDVGRTAVVSSLSKIAVTDDFSSAGTNAYKYTWQPKTITAGMYKFAAVFYDAASAGKVIGYYIDYLYIDGGNDSFANVNYGDKFEAAPANPTWLAVETVFIPQETGTASTTYLAKFHWNDVSTNETGFELVINDTVVNPTNLKEGGLYAPTLLDGTTANNSTLDAGSTSVVLKLNTGTLYTAKIRAINDYSPAATDASAEYCEINRNGDGKGRSYAPIVGDDKQFGMFTVNYALTGGTVSKKNATTGAVSTTAETVTNYIVGYNYHDEQQDLMTDNPLEYPHITKTGYAFNHWNNASSAEVKVISAKNITNLALTAVWSGGDVRVSVTFPSYAAANDVKITDNRNNANTVPFAYSATNNSVSVTAGENLAVTTDSFKLTKPGSGAAVSGDETGVSGSTWTWTPESEPTAGFYCLQITGTYHDADSGRDLTLNGNVYIEVTN